MIQASAKGESYIKRLEVPESKEELLLSEIVNIGAPVSTQELSRMSKMSTNRVEKLVAHLRRAGMVEVEPDSFAGKAAVVISRGLGNIARRARSVDGAQLDRIVLGNTDVLFGTPKKKIPEEGGNDHGESRVRTARIRHTTRPSLRT